jgi:hypothetical protein
VATWLGAACLLYAVFGLRKFHAPPVAAAAVLLWLGAEWIDIAAAGWALFFLRLIAGYGYLCVVALVLAQLFCSAVRRVCPAYTFDGPQAERMEHLLGQLGAYDVVCLQELSVSLGMGGYVDAALARLRGVGFAHAAVAPRWPTPPANFCNNGRPRRGSFVILPPHSHFIWRFPITGTNFSDE